MKKILPGLLMLALLACSPSQTHYDKVDTLAGYKDLTLDAPYELLKEKVEMQLTQDDQCTATQKYKITSRTYLQLGAVQFDKVELEFVRDSLYRTTLYTNYTYESEGQLYAMYRQEFGEPQETKAVGYKSKNWNGKNHTIHVAKRLSSNDIEIEYASNKGLRRSLDAEKACAERKKQEKSQ